MSFISLNSYRLRSFLHICSGNFKTLRHICQSRVICVCPSKTLWDNKVLLVKQGTENGFFYNVIQKVNANKKIVPPVSSLFESLDRILKKEDTSQSNDDLTNLTDSIRKCTNIELVGLLDVLEQNHTSQMFKKVFEAIDREGAFRVSSGEPSVVIAGALRIYELNMFVKSKWTWNVLRRFIRRLNRLSKEEVP